MALMVLMAPYGSYGSYGSLWRWEAQLKVFLEVLRPWDIQLYVSYANNIEDIIVIIDNH